MIDKHTIALISIIGCSLDLLGAMYLAYDLLGGEHGPLRTLTRAVLRLGGGSHGRCHSELGVFAGGEAPT